MSWQQAAVGGHAVLLKACYLAWYVCITVTMDYSAPGPPLAGSTASAVPGELGTSAPPMASSIGTTAAVQLPLPGLPSAGTIATHLFPSNAASTGLPPASQQLDPNIPALQPVTVHAHSRKRKQHVASHPVGSAAAVGTIAGTSAAEKRARPTTRSINGIRVPPVPLSPPAAHAQAPRRRTITDQKAADILIDIARNNISQAPGRVAGGPACGRSSSVGRGAGGAAVAGMARGRRATVESEIPMPVSAEAAREGRVNIGAQRDTLFLALRKHLPKAAGNVQISQMTVTNHVLKVVCTLHLHETYLTKADASDVVEKLNIAVPATRGPAVDLPTFGLASGNREGMMLVTMLSCYVPTGKLHTRSACVTVRLLVMLTQRHCEQVIRCRCATGNVLSCRFFILEHTENEKLGAANLKKSQADPPQDIRTRVKKDLTAIMGICARHLPHLGTTPIPTLSSEAASAVAALNYGNELRSYVTLCRLLYAWRVDPVIRPRLDRLTGNPRALPARSNSAAPMSFAGSAALAPNGVPTGDPCEASMLAVRDSASPPAAPAVGTPVNMSPTHSGNGGNTSVNGALDNGNSSMLSLDAADGMGAGSSQCPANTVVTGVDGNVNPDGTPGQNGAANGGAGTVAYDSRKVMLAQLIVDQVREKTSAVTAVQSLSDQVESILSDVGATGTLEGVLGEMEAKVKALQEEVDRLKGVNESVTKELGEGAERDQLHVVLGKLAASTERMSDDVAYLVIGAKTMISERLLRDLFPDVFSS